MTDHNMIARAISGGFSERPIAGYIPSIPVAVVALVLFGLLAVVQFVHFARMGKKFMLVLCLGTTAMTIGFAMRIVLHFNATSLGIYIIEDLLILLSPTAFLAADYIILTRISAHLGQSVADQCLILPTRLIVRLFVISDISTFLIQAAGGGISAIAATATVGQRIALVGLVLQLVSFASFTVVLLIFGYRVRKHHPSHWAATPPSTPEPSLLKFWKTTPIADWKVLFYAVCYSSIGILTRSSFRIVEFSEGKVPLLISASLFHAHPVFRAHRYFGNIPTHEIYFYLLDSLPLLLAMSVYIFIWPTRFIGTNPAPTSADEHQLSSSTIGYSVTRKASEEDKEAEYEMGQRSTGQSTVV